MSSRRVAVASSDDDADGKQDHANDHDNNDDDDDGDHDGTDTTRIESSPSPDHTAIGNSSARKYVGDQRSKRALASDAFLMNEGPHAEVLAITNEAQSSLQHTQPPPLDFDQLQQRRRSTIRRLSTRARRIDEAPDSLRLESTRRRASTVMKEPSRASVVYSPRALAEVFARQRTETRRAEWTKACSVM